MSKAAQLKKLALPKAPKRTALPEEKARTFEAPRSAAAPAPAKSSPKRRLERGERIAVYIPSEMEEKLRLRCTKERRSISDAVTAAIAAWLAT